MLIIPFKHLLWTLPVPKVATGACMLYFPHVLIVISRLVQEILLQVLICILISAVLELACCTVCFIMQSVEPHFWRSARVAKLERERHTHTHRHRQTDRQRQRDRDGETETEIETEKHRHREGERERQRQTDR